MEGIEKRERFLKASDCQPVDRPPVWLMRQAGRALPEYRELRKKNSFLKLVQTPELSTEVTLQPILRFGFDAAILFSDILVIPEALGQKYHFRDSGGIQMDFTIQSHKDIESLHWKGVADRLQYVSQALKLIKKELNGKHALLGFAGSPWTIANFMLEGGSASSFIQAKKWREHQPALFDQFLEQLTQATISYLEMQIEAGVDAIQIFDSLGSLLDPASYFSASGSGLPGLSRLCAIKPGSFFFAGGDFGLWGGLLNSGAKVISVDWTQNLADIRRQFPDSVAIQGNLDPKRLLASPQEVRQGVTEVLMSMNGRRGYIFNLGHGLPAETPIENLEELVKTISTFAWVN